ncbi:hypothetical protein [Bradyrhizobium sp. 188]|uniref:hypothetical protein n=1 Tax=Bradyrhizobium sp. 188 TaxID=2782656 RepID=UPI001FFAA55C|nr:hypothetical protein [Bradyrhizobium sp. 188]MCK1501462.1 hypothetical protein [Bradyrhizobium sp. 188]
MRAPRRFKPAELAWAMRLAKQGESWRKIGLSLGRAAGSGIRRQLDSDFRERRNAYDADYKRNNRPSRARKPPGAPS